MGGKNCQLAIRLLFLLPPQCATPQAAVCHSSCPPATAPTLRTSLPCAPGECELFRPAQVMDCLVNNGATSSCLQQARFGADMAKEGHTPSAHESVTGGVVCTVLYGHCGNFRRPVLHSFCRPSQFVSLTSHHTNFSTAEFGNAATPSVR